MSTDNDTLMNRPMLKKHLPPNLVNWAWLPVAVMLGSPQALALEGPRLATPAKPEAIAAWSMTVFPDGRGLPPGKGSVTEGQAIYAQRCASCHGVKGGGGSGPELAGASHGLTGPNPDKTLGRYWPYATTLFDYLRRAMPMDSPGSLGNDQVYALVAYLLHLNGLLQENAEMDAASLVQVKMPNRDGFIRIDAPN